MSAISNEELVTDVTKAAITATENLAASGKLNNEQANKFIDFVFDEVVLTNIARTVRFTPETMDIDKIGVGQRVAVAKNEAIDPGIRRGVNTSQVQLTPKEIMVPFEISDIFTEINLEGRSVEEHILRMFATQLGNDLEELYIHGDSAGPQVIQGDIIDGGSTTGVVTDTYLALGDGFLKLAQAGNIVDHAGGVVSANLFRKMLTAMPSKFKKKRRDLRWLVPVEIDELWRERLSSRATGAGDAALNGDRNLRPFGIEMVPMPLLDFYPQQTEVLSFSGSGSTITLGFGPIQAGSVVLINDADANNSPTTPFIEDTDYSVDSSSSPATITHIGAGSIGTTATVRVTYRSFPQIMLTMLNNLIVGIGRDVRIERDRDIYRGVNQFALSVKAAVEIEEVTAVVKADNVSDAL
jgi:hypothetical protein